MKKYILAVFIAGFSIASCNKIIEPKLGDTGQIGSDEFYSNYNGIVQGNIGIYPSVRNTYNGMWFTDLLSDDGESSTGGDQAWADVEINNVDPRSGIIEGVWATAYNGIYRTNTFLGRVPAISGLNINQNIMRDQFIGEALFIRALHYFNLVRLFGDIPLITNELTNLNQLSIARTSKAEVYMQIEKDLLKAIDLLPEVLPNPKLVAPIVGNLGGTEQGRALRGSARTLLGHLYLTTGDFAKAEAALQQVVNSGVYTLNANYSQAFQAIGGIKNSGESIFEAQFNTTALPGAQNSFGSQFGPGDILIGGVANLARNRPTDNTLLESIDLKNTLVQSFQNADNRKAFTVSYNTGSPIRTINRKYYTPTGSQGTNNWVVYRYADVLLMLAEAQQAQGNAAALTNLNVVRSNPRTGLSALVGISGNALRDAIRLERRLELAMEAKRWFDLLRWNTVTEVMQAHARPVKAGSNGLLPIPQAEREKNPLLTQNAGY